MTSSTTWEPTPVIWRSCSPRCVVRAAMSSRRITNWDAPGAASVGGRVRASPSCAAWFARADESLRRAAKAAQLVCALRAGWSFTNSTLNQMNTHTLEILYNLIDSVPEANQSKQPITKFSLLNAVELYTLLFSRHTAKLCPFVCQWILCTGESKLSLCPFVPFANGSC